ncbi:MAG: hypothetical protein HYY81_03780 [Deltaproteobacteria bacterium]|nr:hypothetical protein [Deltaproteobacteria bacterium]
MAKSLAAVLRNKAYLTRAIVEEELFMAHVDLACRVVEHHPACLVLLGIQPSAPEPDYGYIVPVPKVNHMAPLSVHEVLRFIEKPEPHAAQELILRDGLWNTMVMIFKARTMVDLVCRAAPKCTANESCQVSRKKLYYAFRRSVP